MSYEQTLERVREIAERSVLKHRPIRTRVAPPRESLLERLRREARIRNMQAKLNASRIRVSGAYDT